MSETSSDRRTDPVARSLSNKFCDSFLKPVHGMRKTTGTTWWSTISSMYALLYDDGRTACEIKETIDWLREHHGEEYVPDIPTGVKFRHKFNSIRSAMKRTNSSNGGGPRKALFDGINDNAVATKWMNDCYHPARDYLGDISLREEVRLAQGIVKLKRWFERNQERPPRDSEYYEGWWDYVPNARQFVADYVSWLKEQDWIRNPSVAMFDPVHGVLKRFRRYEEEYIGGFDIFTGESK